MSEGCYAQCRYTGTGQHATVLLHPKRKRREGLFAKVEAKRKNGGKIVGVLFRGGVVRMYTRRG